MIHIIFSELNKIITCDVDNQLLIVTTLCSLSLKIDYFPRTVLGYNTANKNESSTLGVILQWLKGEKESLLEQNKDSNYNCCDK